MDIDNLEHLMTIVGLLDRFKERMAQATKLIDKLSPLASLKQSAFQSQRQRKGSEELHGYGNKELQRQLTTAAALERQATLSTSLRRGRALGFISTPNRRREMEFGQLSKEKILKTCKIFRKWFDDLLADL